MDNNPPNHPYRPQPPQNSHYQYPYYPYQFNPYSYYYSYPYQNQIPPNGYYMQPSPVTTPAPAPRPPKPEPAEPKWWEKPKEEPVSKIPKTPLIAHHISFPLKKKPTLEKALPIFDERKDTNAIGKSQNNKKPKKPLPQSLKDYVKKCFGACPQSLHKRMEEKMRKYLLQVVKDGSAFTTDWNSAPLQTLNEDNHNGRNKNKKNKKKNQPQQDDSHSVQSTNHAKFDAASELTIKVSNISVSSKNYYAQTNRQKPPIYRNNQKNRSSLASKCNAVLADHIIEPASLPSEAIDANKKNQRLQRFKCLNLPTTSTTPNYSTSSKNAQVVGVSQVLEKVYLRLTDDPDPANIRPEDVLKRSFIYILNKYQQNKNYHYISEQFKSIRQDLTIQGIKNDFTVKVYEENARISLLNSDREEFNQCQTCLKQLYKDKISGNVKEFLVYNIIYHIYTNNYVQINSILSSLTDDEKLFPDIITTQKLYLSLATRNYLKFFDLYAKLTLPCAKALVEMFISKIRMKFFRAIIFTCLPTVSVEYLAKMLSFPSSSMLLDWLKTLNLCAENGVEIECKKMRLQLSRIA